MEDVSFVVQMNRQCFQGVVSARAVEVRLLLHRGVRLRTLKSMARMENETKLAIFGGFCHPHQTMH